MWRDPPLPALAVARVSVARGWRPRTSPEQKNRRANDIDGFALSAQPGKSLRGGQ
jgi:hypothetical protein